MEEKTEQIFSRPTDYSWQAYRGWVLSFTSALTGKQTIDHYSEDEWKQYTASFWSKGKAEH